MAGIKPKKRPHPDDVPFSLDATIKKVRKRQKEQEKAAGKSKPKPKSKSKPSKPSTPKKKK